MVRTYGTSVSHYVRSRLLESYPDDSSNANQEPHRRERYSPQIELVVWFAGRFGDEYHDEYTYRDENGCCEELNHFCSADALTAVNAAL